MNRYLSQLKFAGAFIISILFLYGCTPLISNTGHSSPEAVEQTIESLATQYTPQAPDDTPAPVEATASVTPAIMPSAVIEEAFCADTQGQIELREIVIPESRHPFAFRIYLPPCYETQTEKRYPVLYLLHGQSYKDDQWDRMGIDETADGLIAAGEIPPMIIVLPWEMNSLEDDKVSLYGDILVERLIPLIDDEYRTFAGQEYRAIGGLSRGAAWAMRIGLTHWELFGSIGAHSYAPFSGDFYNAPYWFKEIPEEKFPRIYMDMGTLDYMLTAARLFEDRLTKYSVPHEWVINRGTHNEEYWSAHAEDYLRWYSFPWRKLFVSDFNNVGTSIPLEP